MSPFRARRMGMKLTAPQSLSRMTYRFCVCAGVEEVEEEAEEVAELAEIAEEAEEATTADIIKQTAKKRVTHMANNSVAVELSIHPYRCRRHLYIPYLPLKNDQPVIHPDQIKA